MCSLLRSILVWNLGTVGKTVDGSVWWPLPTKCCKIVPLSVRSGCCADILFDRFLAICPMYCALQEDENWYRTTNWGWRGNLSLNCWTMSRFVLLWTCMCAAGKQLPEAPAGCCSNNYIALSPLNGTNTNNFFFLNCLRFLLVLFCSHTITGKWIWITVLLQRTQYMF